MARGSGEAGSCRGASAPGGRENLAVHVASHPRRERRVTSPLAGEERSEGAGGSDVGPQRRGHGGSGGGICCLSSGCRPSELGPGARAQRAALRRWLRGRREPAHFFALEPWLGSVPGHHDDAGECPECQQNVGTKSV